MLVFADRGGRGGYGGDRGGGFRGRGGGFRGGDRGGFGGGYKMGGRWVFTGVMCFCNHQRAPSTSESTARAVFVIRFK